MKLVPTALAVTVLAVPVLAGLAPDSAANTLAAGPVAASFDATTLTTLAANGIEQVAATTAGAAVAPSVDAGEAVMAARRQIGGEPRAAVLGPFTGHADSVTRRLAWQVVVADAVLPDGTRGRAWVAVDAASGAVLAARPLLELDAG